MEYLYEDFKTFVKENGLENAQKTDDVFILYLAHILRCFTGAYRNAAVDDCPFLFTVTKKGPECINVNTLKVACNFYGELCCNRFDMELSHVIRVVEEYLQSYVTIPADFDASVVQALDYGRRKNVYDETETSWKKVVDILTTRSKIQQQGTNVNT